MRTLKISLAILAASVFLSGCAVPLLVGGAIGGGLLAYGNDQRANCAAIYKKAAAQKWSSARTKATAYPAGCR